MPVLLVWSDKTKQNQQDLKSGIVREKKRLASKLLKIFFMIKKSINLMFCTEA